ncbi:regulator of nucleoside diphosphate kinase [Escherichia coli]|uniref:Regulator of nucleoside diphosphate kinase n=2 Tax=Escherichia coli TaxID=562 RepID=A0A376MT79_ECOLX|nr:regulator of nucleoside diphosphate kinase [Escherichia coli]
MSRPTIIINDLDAERIDILLEQPAYAGLPIADALNAELDRAQMCSPEEMPHDVVTMNSRVKFRNLSDGEVRVRTLVYPAKNDRQQYSAFRYGSGRCCTAGAARWRFHSLGTSGRRCNSP